MEAEKKYNGRESSSGHVRRIEDGRLPKAAQNWEITARHRRGRPLITWDHNIEQAMEKFGLADERALERDRRSSQIRGFV